MTIWKFPLDPATLSLTMPMGAEILSLHLKGKTPTIWALVDETAPTENVPIEIYGPGHTLPANPGKFIGAFQTGPYVFHVFKAAV